MSERIFIDPIRDPKGFLKAPFGKSVREMMRDHLSEISDHAAAITLLCERYPWLLSKEDLQYLEEIWARMDQIRIHNKNG